MTSKELKKNNRFILIALFFGIIYSLISLVNHYVFRTYALDLGLYTHALYDYSHGHWSDTAVMQNEPQNLLGDHFDLFLMLISPLSHILGSYTLLVIQIVAVLTGGLGVYLYFKKRTFLQLTPLSAAIYFFVFFGTFSSISYDYHSNVIAAMTIPWFLIFVEKRNHLISFLLFLLILITKENMALWMSFISLGSMAIYFKDKKLIKTFALFGILSLIYFICVTTLIMPSFTNDHSFSQMRYSILGNNLSDACLFIFQNPMQVIRILFTNHLHLNDGNFVKMEFWIFFMISGGLVLLLNPKYIIMLIPVFFQKFFHDSPGIWSAWGQYSIEFAPILTIGIFSFINRVKNKNTQSILIIIVLIANLCVTLRLMDHTVYFFNKSTIRFYKMEHYQRNYNVSKVYSAMALIPKDAIVSAQSPFLPHLALRRNIYQFPIIKNAEYVLYSTEEGAYPLSKQKFIQITDSLVKSSKWEIMQDDTAIKILKLKSPSPPHLHQ